MHKLIKTHFSTSNGASCSRRLATQLIDAQWNSYHERNVQKENNVIQCIAIVKKVAALIEAISLQCTTGAQLKLFFSLSTESII